MINGVLALVFESRPCLAMLHNCYTENKCVLKATVYNKNYIQTEHYQ